MIIQELGFPCSVTLSQENCRMEACPLAQTGSLLTSGTSLWCPQLPSRSPFSLLALSPSTLSRLSLVVTPCLSSAASHNPVTSLDCPDLHFRSSGFSPPLCYQASQALSPQYYPQICHPLLPPRLGSLPTRLSFMASPKHSRPEQEDFPG